MSQPPLVVDLDGTLIDTDLLHEAALSYGKNFTTKLPNLALWLRSGKSFLKERLVEHVPLDPSTLPYNEKVLALISQKKDEGAQIILATSSHEKYATQIADHLGCFDGVIATRLNFNLSAENKRDELVNRYGARNFDYVGNSMDDVVVWESARRAYIVNASARVINRAQQAKNVETIIKDDSNKLQIWMKAIRPHQWIKNLLIFIPILAAHQVLQIGTLLYSLVAMICFCLCASSVYLSNDLLDINDDRHHPKKKGRPFAAGKLKVLDGLTLSLILLLASISLSITVLPQRFTEALICYYLLTVAYSFYLKRKVMVDVVTLAGLYTIRIIAGAAAVGLSLTFWILAFSMFIFMSLAFVKRYAEVYDSKKRGKETALRGRGYEPQDLEILATLGASAGYISVLVMALYIQDVRTVALYSHPQYIWIACPLLLFWISRIWLIAHRGKMHHDPVVFAVTDRVSAILVLTIGLAFWMAI